MSRKTAKKNKNNSLLAVFFVVGLIAGLILGLMLCPPCDQILEEECVPTCLLIRAVDSVTGEPLANAYIAIFDINGTLIVDGLTDAQGYFLIDLPIFGCGEGLTKIYLEGENLIGFWHTEVILGTGSGAYPIDETTGCIFVVIRIDTSGD